MNKSFLFLSLISIAFFGCGKKQLLEKISADHSGIHFNNIIQDSDSLNVLTTENIYNGGGVGIGDFNNDGLQDIYFTGNMVPNKLYLNKKDFKFDDVTEASQTEGEGKWCRGVSVVDINKDGKLDIYVAATILKDSTKRENILYVNQGNNENGIPRFKNMAAEYGLNVNVHSTMAAFFDYDNDGDLDMYLVVNEILRNQFPNQYRTISRNSENPNTDKLFRNDWNDSLKHPVFSDVSREAGITIEGYGHGVNITDINLDGWKDVYVTNDFISNNLLYINNHDGTFTEKSARYFKHTAANSMGTDIMDINNDGLVDIVEADMNPEDNFRKKMMMNPNSYQNYQNSEHFGYQYQYVRNTLQLNQGFRVKENDSIGDPIFSDIGFFSGIAETDWSWATLLADVDNDSYRDLFISNGFPKDVTDHDFMSYRSRAISLASMRDILDEIPVVKIPNYIFRNKDGLNFENKGEDWMERTPSFSNGAAYADFDNDGDLDLVVNNINDEAFLYRNNLEHGDKDDNHFFRVNFDTEINANRGIGAWVEIYYDKNKKQVMENTPYRGYLSSMQNTAHFGLGATSILDSVLIKWPNGRKQVLFNVKADQTIDAKIKDADKDYDIRNNILSAKGMFSEITSAVGLQYLHEEQDYIDFNMQRLLPHKFSEYGPALATGDIDGNGTDDIILGGSKQKSAQLFFQTKDNRFTRSALLSGDTSFLTKKNEDQGILLFDADNDNDLDLYIASGGAESVAGSKDYQDRLYVNDGRGHFTLDSLAIPVNHTSKSCVRASDIDKDGDLDIFIAGRVEPNFYPRKVSSFIYRNDSKGGLIRFTEITKDVAPALNSIGLVCDAIFSDFDNDQWPDLILAGEGMPVTFLKNNKGKFEDISTSSGINDQLGFWNSLCPADFDNDGDMDYVAGNLGTNTFYRATPKEPLGIMAKDFDKNGSFDAIPYVYLPVSMVDPTRKKFPVHTRDDMIKQIISTRANFPSYKSYANATVDKLQSPEQLKDVIELTVNNLHTVFIENKGSGQFSITSLPAEVQFSVINGMIADDFNGDNNIDLLINGNDFGTEPGTGRYDAFNGLLLLGNGKNSFTPRSIIQSGVYIPGNGKALIKCRNNDGYLVVGSQNRGTVKAFRLRNGVRHLSVRNNDISATIHFKNGSSRKEEFFYGASFMSQSARFVCISPDVISVEITDSKGNKRKAEW